MSEFPAAVDRAVALALAEDDGAEDITTQWSVRAPRATGTGRVHHPPDISVGMLTHSAPALDVSMMLTEVVGTRTGRH